MKIALVGNQNSGKTTLFNLLTGTNQKIGNWPGVTIERKIGKIKELGYDLVDLPGVYSLSPYTIEEEVSRKYVLEEKPDMIINIVDSTSIERSLYLTTQIMELDTKVIIALNMADRLEAKGIHIDTKVLSQQLGTEVISISALKGEGIEELKNTINKYNGKHITSKEIFRSDIENEILHIRNRFGINRFLAIKILENDKMYPEYQIGDVKNRRNKLEEIYKMDIEEIIANARYDYIVKIKNRATTITPVKETTSDKLDKVFLNKFLAFPIFIIIMFLVYYLSVGVVGSFTVDWVAELVDKFGKEVSNFLINIGASSWSQSLVVDGIIAGVGAVLGFVPQLIILFLCISILETSGYMSRVTFLLDKLFRKFGLSGEALIPFIVGLGCSVPAIMSTRVIKDTKERELSIMLTPFIPCSAKLPIIAMFSGYFFTDKSGLVSASLYFLAILIILISAIIIKKVFMKNSGTAFISELPEFKLPSIKYISKDVFDKVKEFIKRAGTIILFCSVIIWFLLSFSWKLEYGIEIKNSILASIGNAISWAFYPILGTFSWEATVSAIQGLVAKEQVISSMSIIAGLNEEMQEGAMLFKSESFSFFNASSAYAFMVFNLFSAPCFGAIGAMRREFGSTKKMLNAVLFQTTIAWILASIVFNVGTFISSNLSK